MFPGLHECGECNCLGRTTRINCVSLLNLQMRFTGNQCHPLRFHLSYVIPIIPIMPIIPIIPIIHLCFFPLFLLSCFFFWEISSQISFIQSISRPDLSLTSPLPLLVGSARASPRSPGSPHQQLPKSRLPKKS